jgi:hypothetical protein
MLFNDTSLLVENGDMPNLPQPLEGSNLPRSNAILVYSNLYIEVSEAVTISVNTTCIFKEDFIITLEPAKYAHTVG